MDQNVSTPPAPRRSSGDRRIAPSHRPASRPGRLPCSTPDGSMPDGGHGARGFTLTETIITVAILGFLMLALVPKIQHLIKRSRQEGAVREVAMLMSRARLEAIKRNTPVVVGFNYTNDEIFAYADVDGANWSQNTYDPTFNPTVGAPSGETDYMLKTLLLPAGVFFWGGGDSSEEGTEAVSGFYDADSTSPNIAVFAPDGTVKTAGGVRIGDNRGNHFEVRVAPRATARVAVRKYDPDRAVNTDGTFYYEQDEDGEKWEWIE